MVRTNADYLYMLGFFKMKTEWVKKYDPNGI